MKGSKILKTSKGHWDDDLTSWWSYYVFKFGYNHHEGDLYIKIIRWKIFFSLFNCENSSYRNKYLPKYFFSAIENEFLRTASSTLSLRDFISKEK